MNTPVSRFIHYLQMKNIKHATIERELGLGNGYLRKQLNGKGTIGSETLAKLNLKFSDLSLNWIITGNGEMLTSSPLNMTEKEELLYLRNRVEELKSELKLTDSALLTVKKNFDDLESKYLKILLNQKSK